jgi:hypothetical protein
MAPSSSRRPTDSGRAGHSGPSRSAEARLPPAHGLVIADTDTDTDAVTGQEAGPDAVADAETATGAGTAAGATPGPRPPRMRLRPWRPGDVPALLRGVADAEYRRWNTPKMLVETGRHGPVP